MLIPCPWCGERDLAEFSYGGDAGKAPARNLDSADAREWLDGIYLRANPRGPHLEYWHHVAGCRQWIAVERDTLTHEIRTASMAAGAERERAEP